MQCGDGERPLARGLHDSFAHRFDGAGGLFDKADTFDADETGAEFIARKGQHRIPRAGLRRDQAFRLGGAITEEIGAGIFHDVGDDGFDIARDAVDR